MLVKVVDLAAVVHAEADRDDRLGWSAEERGIDVGVVAPDNSVLTESAHTFEARRGRKPDCLGQVFVRDPRVLLYGEQNLAIDSVEPGLWSSILRRLCGLFGTWIRRITTLGPTDYRCGDRGP